MSEQRVNIYEGLFLFPHSASANLQSAADHVKEILHRADAEIISFRKWDERRLAYEIKGNKRGVYFLVYFKAPAGSITGIERDTNLSETLLRSMMTRADHLTEEQIQSADGRQELDDEIQLRAAAEAAPEASTAQTTVSTPETRAAEKPVAETPATETPAAETEAPAATPGS